MMVQKKIVQKDMDSERKSRKKYVLLKKRKKRKEIDILLYGYPPFLGRYNKVLFKTFEI